MGLWGYGQMAMVYRTASQNQFESVARSLYCRSFINLPSIYRTVHDRQKFVTCPLSVQTYRQIQTHTHDQNGKLKNSYLKFATNEMLLGNYKLNANG